MGNIILHILSYYLPLFFCKKLIIAAILPPLAKVYWQALKLFVLPPLVKLSSYINLVDYSEILGYEILI